MNETNFTYSRTGTVLDISVALDDPADGTNTTDSTDLFSVTHGDASGNMTNTTFYFWYDNSTIFNIISSIVTGTTNTSNTTVTGIPLGDFNWNYETCSITFLGTTCTRNETNFTWTRQAFVEDSFFFNTSVLETDNETFQFNITTVPSVTSVSASLNYDGIRFGSITACNGSGFCVIQNLIDIPLVSSGILNENKSFFWELTVFDGGTTPIFGNSSLQQNNVTMVQFNKCNSSSSLSQSVNFTINEESNVSKSITANFMGDFNYWLGGGSVKRQNSTEAVAPSVDLCQDTNRTVYVDARIDLSALHYDTRAYDFIKRQYTNTSTTVGLFMLNDTEDRDVIIDVKDQSLVQFPNLLTEISRFYPEEGMYRIVESRLTDDLGEFVASLVENDVRYRFEFKDLNLKTLKVSDIISVACRASICLLPFVIEDTTSEFDDFVNLTSYTSSLSFSNNTNIFTFSWDDKREEVSTHRLLVSRFQFNGSADICDTTSTAPVGVITCDTSGISASFNAEAFRTPALGDHAGEERRISVLNIKVGDISQVFGKEGLLWIFILLFTLIAVGTFNPTIGIVLYLGGFTVFGLLGIISFTFPIFIANMVIGVIFIWAFRS